MKNLLFLRMLERSEQEQQKLPIHVSIQRTVFELLMYARSYSEHLGIQGLTLDLGLVGRTDDVKLNFSAVRYMPGGKNHVWQDG